MEEAIKKREGLTLAQLASYDDFITDALIDNVYFWSTIRKNRGRYSASRHLREDEITKILQESVVIEKDAAKGCERILNLPGVQRYKEKLSPEEEEHFQRHMRKYVNIYLPDCPFEVSTTNRYQIDQQEACVVSRKLIKKGDVIKYLSGIQVSITREEEQALDVTRLDFSIVRSSRKKMSSLFLGPARFANHDCEANARLSTKGPHSMMVIAAKDIAIGDEITVSYGSDYFGPGNRECLCYTCEKLLRNAWDPKHRVSDSGEGTEDDEDTETPGTPGRNTPQVDALAKAPAISYSTASSSKTGTPELSTVEQSRKRKREASDSPRHSHKEPRLDEIRSPFRASPSRLRQELRFDENMSRVQDSRLPHGRYESTPPSVFEHSHERSSESTAATSLEDHRLEDGLKVESADDEPVTTTSIWSMPPPQPRAIETRVTLNGVQLDSPSSSFNGPAASDSDLSDLDENLEVDDTSQQIIRKRRLLLRRATHNNSSPDPSASPLVDESLYAANPNARRPGDYRLTRRLLAKPYSRWVKCRTCREKFVQNDAYQTRAACPRCERHSKLYGYVWPKTDKIGKNDKEERVLDHREVNRFVHPDQERRIKKGKKTTAELLRQESERKARGSEWETDSEDEGPMPKPLIPKKRKPRALVIDSDSDDDGDQEDEVQEIVAPLKRKRLYPPGALINGRRPQKRDFNPDGTLREKRKYKWSGKYIGKWHRGHPKVEGSRKASSKLAAQNAMARAGKALTDEPAESPREKRPYNKTGKYAGRHKERNMKQEDKKAREASAVAAMAVKKRGRPSKLKILDVEETDESHQTESPQQPTKVATKPRKPGWKGWVSVDQEGNEVSPPHSPTEKVTRFHPKVRDNLPPLDVKPERYVRLKQSANTSSPGQGASSSKQNASSGEQAPKRHKGWAWVLDTDTGSDQPEPVEDSVQPAETPQDDTGSVRRSARRSITSRRVTMNRSSSRRTTNKSLSVSSPTIKIEPEASTSPTRPASSNSTATKTAPKRVKGYVYLDENNEPLPNPLFGKALRLASTISVAQYGSASAPVSPAVAASEDSTLALGRSKSAKARLSYHDEDDAVYNQSTMTALRRSEDSGIGDASMDAASAKRAQSSTNKRVQEMNDGGWKSYGIVPNNSRSRSADATQDINDDSDVIQLQAGKLRRVSKDRLRRSAEVDDEEMLDISTASGLNIRPV